MNNLWILFPCSPLDGLRKVDEDFHQEMEAAIKAGFKIIFFDHDLLVKEGVVKFSAPLPEQGRILLRGWMLTLEQYEKLYAACGSLMFTDPYAYEHKHYWPKAYEQHYMLRQHSPRCFWTDTREFSVKHIKQFFGGEPIVVKDHVKSAKGAKNAMFIKNSADRTEVFTVINNMIAERGTLFQRGIVLKQHVPLDVDKEGNTIEFRAFFLGGRAISVEPNGCNWDYLLAQGMTNSTIVHLLERLGSELGGGFYTIDLMLSNKTWMVLECGDGQVSGLAPKANPFLFYERLRFELKKSLPPEPEEKMLADDYPVYWDYLYVADGKVVRSDIKGTVADLRRDLEGRGITAKEITSCDIVTRGKLAKQ